MRGLCLKALGIHPCPLFTGLHQLYAQIKRGLQIREKGEKSILKWRILSSVPPNITSYLRLYFTSELSTGRMDPRVGSGRVGSGQDFAGFRAGRVGSGQHFGFFNFLLIISWYLNRYESSNTTFGLIDFLRYLIYNN